jgi:hypothetical protein
MGPIFQLGTTGNETIKSLDNFYSAVFVFYVASARTLFPFRGFQLRFRGKSKFYRVGLSAQRPTPNLDQGLPLSLGHHL